MNGHTLTLRRRARYEYARIIPPLCKLLILIKQTRLVYQRVPLENEFARCLEPFEYARNRFRIQVGALDFLRRIKGDLFDGQDILADEPHQRGITDTAVLGGLAKR